MKKTETPWRRPGLAGVAARGRHENDSVRHEHNRALEIFSVACSIPATSFLAVFPGGTQIWMWILWLVGSIMMVVWAIRVRAWGVLALNSIYSTLDVLGLTRLLLS